MGKSQNNRGNPMYRMRQISKLLMVFMILLFSTATLAMSAEIFINIPSQEADAALRTFAKQTGFSLMYSVDEIGKPHTRAVAGKYSPVDALKQMLEGTGLSYDQPSAKTIAIRKNRFQTSDNTESVKSYSLLAENNDSAAGGQQATGKKADKKDGDYMLEEVIVTSRKQSENVQNIPISITTMDTKMLERRNINILDEMVQSMPNVVTSGGGQHQATFSIRGLSTSTNNPGVDSSIGMYIDEVFLGTATAFDTALLGAERIEVLRGPQGTLYGRNTIGGVINIVTKKPTHEFEGEASLNVGNYHNYKFSGFLSGPILKDKVAAIVSASIQDRDGFLDDFANDVEYNKEDNYAVRGKVNFNLSEKIGLDLSADFFHDDNDGGIYDILSGALAAADPTPISERSMGSNIINYTERNIAGTAARLVCDLDNFELVSITSYRTNESNGRQDADYSVADFLTTGRELEQDQFSQEIRLASKNQGPLNYITGLYYFHSSQDTDQYVAMGDDMMAMLSGMMQLPFIPAAEYMHTLAAIKGDAYAIFGSAEYEITNSIILNAGLRYSHEKKEMDYVQEMNPGAWVAEAIGQGIDVPARTENIDEGEVSGNISLRYLLNDDVSLYGTYSHGYKAGGFNATFITYSPDQLVFNAEMVDQYEIGFKSTLLDKRLRFNMAAFYLDYKDKQEQIVTGTIVTVENAGEATIKGFEVEIAARPHRQLTLHGSFGYLDATYDKFIVPSGADHAGNKLWMSPEYTLSFGGTFIQPLSSNFQLVINSEVSYEDESFATADNDPVAIRESGTFINGRIGIESVDGKYSLSLWCKNLSDVERFEDVMNDGMGTQTVYLSNPRTFGLEARVRF